MLAFSESRLRYDIKHSKKSVTGICGINKNYWADELRENGIKINSLKSCEYVLNYYLEQNSGNKKAALREYKGVLRDKKVGGSVVETILQKEKELKKELK